jgi:alpha-amylase
MKTICLYFQVHQPFRFRRYRFFDIGESHYYYDDYANESIMHKVAEKCYIPANKVLLDLIREYGSRFRVAFSISGVALDQFEMYAPHVLESFKELAKSGSVEFLAETYAHSLSALKDSDEFREQVNQHSKRIEELFGQKPTVFRNTELVYSDAIGSMVHDMGFQAMLTEGAKHVLGWKSPNYLYYSSLSPKLRVLLKNFKLSDDIAFRFSNRGWSEWPLTAEKYVSWLKALDNKEEVVNLFMDYETFGEHQWADSGIFHFLKAFPKQVFSKTKFTFSTPSEVAKTLEPVAAIHVPYPISWADEERDLTAWLGNDMQNEAFNKLYALKDLVRQCDDPAIHADWKYLQVSDHFYYMSTKYFSDGEVHKYFNPYESPYDAFINYMNILSDFSDRVRKLVSDTAVEVTRLSQAVRDKEQVIEKLKAELNQARELAYSGEAMPKEGIKKPAKAVRKTASKSLAASKKTNAKKEPARAASRSKSVSNKSSAAKAAGTRKKS